jgi:uncharacterized protein (TIGR00255 family)
MTAFARAFKEGPDFLVTLEIRTLNSRNLDVVVRLPKNLLELEEGLRKQVAQSLRRGRVELFAAIDAQNPEQKAPRINPHLARHYWQQLQDLHRQLPGAAVPSLADLLRIPYLFETREPAPDLGLLREVLKEAAADALEQVTRMRALEGQALGRDLLTRLASLSQDLDQVEQRKAVVLEEYRERLHSRVQELAKGIDLDGNRLLQEVAFFAERSDIHEETTRLRSHLEQMVRLVLAPDAAEGRKLDFLTQELHREVNTIGSKTNDLETTHRVVHMKGEIGKLKEQVQNIE